MSENIEDIIKSLTNLKNKQEKSSDTETLIQKFKKYKSTNEELTQKIVNSLKEIEKNIIEIESSKKDYFEVLEEVVDPTFVKKPFDKKIKRYYKQESVLTSLMNSQNYQTVYNIFFAFLGILIANFLFTEYNNSSFTESFTLIFSLFNGVLYVLINTFYLFLTTVFYVVFFQFFKLFIKNKLAMIILTFCYIYFFCLFYINLEIRVNLSHVCKIMYYTELIRSLLKIWAYFSEKCLYSTYFNLTEAELGEVNAKNVIKDEDTGNIILNDNGEKLEISFVKKVSIKDEIKAFARFYALPTMVYRDSYPTNRSINYYGAFSNFINFLMAVMFLFLIYKVFIVQYFNDETNVLDKGNLYIFKILINYIILSIIVLFVLFFGLFHSFLNFTADLMQFSDRNFYKPFWSSRNPVNFYRNLVFNYEEFFLYYIKYTYERYVGPILAEILRVAILIVTFEFIFYRSLNYFTGIIPFTLIVSHIFTLPFIKIKSQRMILLTWLAVSLELGFFCMIMISDFYFVMSLKEKGDHYLIGYGGFWTRFMNYYTK